MAVTIRKLAQSLGAEAWGDLEATVHGAAEPAEAGEGVLALAMTPAYAQALRPGAVAIVARGMDPAAYGLRAAIFAPRPRLVMAGLTRAFDPGPGIAPGIHASAVIDPTARIGADAAIGPFAVIGPGVAIGPRARIGAHVSIGRGACIGADALILDGVRIGHDIIAGDRLIAQPGAVIGADGFSFVTPEELGVEEIRRSLGQRGTIRQQHWERIHSLGGVEIGDDVEIGANSCIDRATLTRTVIGAGTMIDNLVHIAHNVQIGKGCIIVAQVGISGSTVLEDYVVLGGQVGIADHIHIGKGARVASRAALFRDAPAGAVLGGFPAVPVREWHRQSAFLLKVGQKKGSSE